MRREGEVIQRLVHQADALAQWVQNLKFRHRGLIGLKFAGTFLVPALHRASWPMLPWVTAQQQ